jgi:ribose 1,5-bisphosphokinase
MYWEAHGHGYGLARCMDHDIRSGRSVVVNVSRSVIDDARRAYRHVVVVAITAPADVLAERIRARGRSSDGPIENRLRREIPIADAPDAIIHNVGWVTDHGRELLRIIRG